MVLTKLWRALCISYMKMRFYSGQLVCAVIIITINTHCGLPKIEEEKDTPELELNDNVLNDYQL